VSGVFYDRFERHAHGEGLKAQSTHYCAGCGHGLVHKYLAEAIGTLGIQNRTVAISPVGCSVFLYYYLDVGNTQAPHGRAPAVAIAHKLANPESIVVCYQGDGDLASIGLAEIVSTAQQGLPISVIFVNNAIYGMTGGQMAPTTLMNQKTASSPYGRERSMGQPMKMAELIAGLDGPVYVERVALFDAKQRNRARNAILKALTLQVKNRGFSFVEVLAECPTHLKLTPRETEQWVRERMLPAFPLGVKKDDAREPWFRPAAPLYDADQVLAVIGGSAAAAPRFCVEFPSHIDAHDVALKLAGAGGDGAQTAAMLIARAGINEGFDATHIPSYGPESRGGTSYADVHVASDEVLSPASPEPARADRVQRAESREVRAGRPARRDHHLRQLGDNRSACCRAGCGDPRCPAGAHCRRSRQPGRQEHRRARRATGRHGPVSGRHLPHCNPAGAVAQRRRAREQRGGVRQRRGVDCRGNRRECGPRMRTHAG